MKRDHFQIVVTGGPGAGKTTALDLFQREFKSIVKIVPEAATVLFQSGIVREQTKDRMKELQHSIFKLQVNLEDIFHSLYPERLLICDRGTLDGLAYWPNGEQDFLNTIDSTLDVELQRYDAVIFFQSGAAHGDDLKSNNPYRSEDAASAILLDEKLKRVWERHPNFHYIPSNHSFMNKISQGLLTIQSVLEEIRSSRFARP
jgi:predicted ATPase